MRILLYLSVLLLANFVLVSSVLAEENFSEITLSPESINNAQIIIDPYNIDNSKIAIETKNLDVPFNVINEAKQFNLRVINAVIPDKIEHKSPPIYQGHLFFNDRLRVLPEINTTFMGGANAEHPIGAIGRFRTCISALVFKDQAESIVGEGRINARINMGLGYNPLKNRSLSLVDSEFSDTLGPNAGVNIGDGLSTKYGFFDNLNYTQKIKIKNVEWTQAYGLIDLSEYFDTNTFAGNTGWQFLNSTFTNNRTLQANVSTLSALWKFRGPFLTFTITASPLDPVHFDNAFSSVGEIAYSPKIKGLQGNYRIGLGTVLGRHIDDYLFHDNSLSFYSSFDQQITKNIGIFARYGNAGVSNADKFPFFMPTCEATKATNPVLPRGWFFKSRNKMNMFSSITDYLTSNNYGANGLPVRQTFSFGMQIDKPFKIKKGTLAFAYGQNYRIFRGRNIDAYGNPVPGFANFTNRAAEKVIEIDYRHKLNKLLSITSFIQVILNKAGIENTKPSFFFGLRTNCYF